MGLISSVVVVRLLGPEEYGRYTLVVTIATFLAIPTMAGLPQLIIREIASSDVNKDMAHMHNVVRWSNRFVLTSSLAISSIAVFLVWLDWLPIAEGLQSVLILGLLLIPFFAFAEITSATLQARHRVFWALFPNQVVRPVLMILALSFASQFKPTLTASDAVFSLIAVLLCVLAIGRYLVRLDWSKMKHSETASTSENPEWLRALLPLSVIFGLQVIHGSIDIFLIGIITDTTDVGFYRISLTISTLAAIGVTTMRLIASPYYAKAHRENDMTTIDQISRLSRKVSLASTATLTLLFYLFGGGLVSLVYGPEFLPSYLPAVILCLGQTVFAIWGPLGALFIMAKQEPVILRVQIFLVALNFLGNIILIPHFGINGAAVATAATYGVNGLMLAYFRKRLRIYT